IFNPPVSAFALLKTINGELGLFTATRSRKKLVDALNVHLLAQREAGRRSLVVIDEAQALSIDVLEHLRLLSNLETTTEKLLRIIVVGQPQLRMLLLHPELVQLNQRITLRWHIGPLTRRETAAYIEHRLAIASRGQAGRIFTRPALRLIHRHSDEAPRDVAVAPDAALVATAPPATIAPPPAPPGDSGASLPDTTALEQRLRALDTRSSAHEALDAVFTAWSVRTLGPREPADAGA